MDLRKLREFLLGDTELGEILVSISSEIESYKSALAKRGASAGVIGTNGDFTHIVKRADVRKLCKQYLEGQFDEWHLNYIANLMELSPSFLIEDEVVKDAIFDLSSPEINGRIDKERIAAILRRLE